MTDLNASEVVSKSEFAHIANVSVSRVSHWLSDGKISGAAIVGAGRHARIHVAIALQQLRRTLDVGQAMGNGLDTQLGFPAFAAAADTIEAKLKREKLEGLQRANRKAAEEEAARAGIYARTADVQQEMGRLAGRFLSIFEGSLGELATAIAARFSVQHRDVLHLLRVEFRAVRARASTTLQQASTALPEFVEDDVPAETAATDAES